MSQAIEEGTRKHKRFGRNPSDAFEAEYHWGSRNWAEPPNLKSRSGGPNLATE